MADYNLKKYIQWFINCGLLNKDHPINCESIAVQDFKNLLQDGVILCNLCKHLNPHIIESKDFSLRPNASQVKYRIFYYIFYYLIFLLFLLLL